MNLHMLEHMYNWYLKITKLSYLGLNMSSYLVVGKYSGSRSIYVIVMFDI